MSTPTTVSAHGAEIPVMGFGTSGLGRSAAELVAIALRLGYRHIDTARKYGTERGVGDGIRASGVPREEIFLTTKVSSHHPVRKVCHFSRMRSMQWAQWRLTPDACRGTDRAS